VTVPVAPGRLSTPAARWVNEATATAPLATAASSATTAPDDDGRCCCSQRPASRATMMPARTISHAERASVPIRVTDATPGALAWTHGGTDPTTSRTAPTATRREIAPDTHPGDASGREGAGRGRARADGGLGVRFPSPATTRGVQPPPSHQR